MLLLYFLLKLLLLVLLIIGMTLLLAYLLKPELLTLPYSTFISLFVKNPPFVDRKEFFPGSKLLEDNWESIREELLSVLENEEAIPKFHEVDGIQRFISANDDVAWRTFAFKAYDTWIDKNCQQAPKTTELLQQLPEVSLAMFSILDGGKHIPRHFGFFKGVFRYHIALIVPDDNECYITVGGQRYDWKEGEGVLFDDTFMHEVWNKSKHKRAVLFLDIYRDKSLPVWLRPLESQNA